jgi:hypothetical protein
MVQPEAATPAPTEVAPPERQKIAE